MLVALLMGFSSGLPLLLTGSVLQAWMTDEGVDLGTIGLFALVGLAVHAQVSMGAADGSLHCPIAGPPSRLVAALSAA